MGATCCKENTAGASTQKPDSVPVPEGSPGRELTIEERLGDSVKRRTGCRITDAYKIGKTLGRGGFSIVRLCVEKASGERFACKIMDLAGIGEEVEDGDSTREDVFQEIEILCTLDHENVLFMKEFFVEESKVYLITELLEGGELLDAVLEQGSYSEADARVCFKQLLNGISYLHSKNIVHRDLKLENLMLASHSDITTIKIVDFGLANLNLRGQDMDTICGTPQYVAPEVIEAKRGVPYDRSVDMWSAGVILFILLGGYPPFFEEDEVKMFHKIRRGEYSFDDVVWSAVSESAKDLVRSLLQVQPATRITASGALNHPWVTGDVSCQPLEATQEKLKKTYPRKFRKAVNVVVTINKMKKLVQSNQTVGDKAIALDG